MKFIPLDNMKKMFRRAAVQAIDGTTVAMTFTDITGNTSRSLYPFAGTNLYSPFYCQKFNGTVYPATSYSGTQLTVRAASDKNISSSAYAPTTEIGSSTCTYSDNGNHTGWNMNITVTATEGSKINSLFFTKGLYFSSSGYYEAAIFAVELDNEVTVDSTGIANFTFAIEF